MSFADPDQEKIELKVELAELSLGLTGPEQHRLKTIRENLRDPLKADYDHVKSFRTAQHNACLEIADSLKSIMPGEREKARERACQQIRDYVLYNSIFERYA